MSCTGSCHGHINFTSRGKLLLIDIEKAKRDEFHRRRKLRLQQVRQQSNEIAREIRDKVKAEKIIKGSKEELKRQAYFKTWKKSQMKTLQDEFNRRAAIAEQDKENTLKERELSELEKERQQVLDEIAKKRGNLAVLKQRKEKLAIETDSFLKTSNAKFNRSLENLRSALVSSLPKPDSKKAFTEPKSSLDRKFDSVDTALYQNCEGEASTSGNVQDHDSVMRVISSENNSVKKPLESALDVNVLTSYQSSNFGSSRYDSPEKVAEKYCTSPERQSYHTSPKKSAMEKNKPLTNTVNGSYHHIYSPHSTRSFRESRTFSRPTVTSHSASCVSPRKGFQGETSYSPGKRLASNILMSPSKRVAGSSHRSHSASTSPVRCKGSYSPNRFKDELKSSQSSHVRSRQVRFENIPSPDRSSIYQSPLGRNRTLSECDSEVSFESDVTWPPRYWNRYQNEEVTLYDHCGRSTSKYLPKHTVSVMPNELISNGLEEEIEACRERALKRHEETLRERRGCRALYRQRLRAEFSCMISDLAKLDKKTRLAKLESEAKAALLTKKQGNRLPTENCNEKDKIEVAKYDTPGNVKVMECIDRMEVDGSDSKIIVEMTSQDVMDCNLNALDQLMERLKRQRDHLLACHQHEEEVAGGDDGTVQSKSVQCNTRPSVDMATSPREASPIDMSTDPIVNRKESRATSPINLDFHSVLPPDCKVDSPLKKQSPQKDTVLISNVHEPKSSTPTKIADESYQVTPELLEHEKDESLYKPPSSYKSLESNINDSKLISPIKISDGSKSSGSVEASSYSFEGVKVEVKVTKNKSTRHEKKEKVKIDTKKPLKDSSIMTLDMPDNQVWAKKLAENDSSGGTSYMSPPDELNTDEHKLLISVLEGMDKKNSNPVLRMYIQKLLSMSKGSLENMSISVSDDSKRSETFRTCFESNSEVDKKQSPSLTSFITVKSNENRECTYEKELNSHLVKKVISDPVKKILESDEESLCSKDIRRISSQPAEVIQESGSIDKTMYINALKHYNDRLKKLAKAMREPPLQNGENDTSYLDLPSSVNESVKLPEFLKDLGLTCPEVTVEPENKEDITSDFCLPPGPPASTWDGFSSILPKPVFESDRERRPKPPSTINNYTSRGIIKRDEVLQHELSTIAEADSKLLCGKHPSSKQQQSSMEPGNSKISISPFEEKISEDSFHTLPPTGLQLPSDTSFISSTYISPVKPAEESSLHIFSELPDSSFGQSSAEEVAVSEVFRSLGIGWALSTWRKTHAASKKKESSSSSSSDAVGVSKRKSDYLRCLHSTPIKTSDAEKNIKMLEDDSDNLTPPSVNLYPRYQNLIRSATEISSSSDL